MRSNSVDDARNSVNQLTALVSEMLTCNRNMSQRLADMEARLPMRDSSSNRPPRQDVIEDSMTYIRTRAESVRTRSPDAHQTIKTGFAFEDDLRKSRPYTRVDSRDGKFSSKSSAVHSTGLSSLSGLSLADVPDLSVLNLVVSRSELWNRDHYERSQSAFETPQEVSRSSSKPLLPSKPHSPKSRLSGLFMRSLSISDVAKAETHKGSQALSAQSQSQKVLILGERLATNAKIDTGCFSS